MKDPLIMKLRKHLAPLATIDQTPALKYRIRQYFSLGPAPLLVELRRAHLGQADVVLALMRINTATARRIAESMIGKPITIGPSCRFIYQFNRQTPTIGRQPVIVWVMEREKAPLRKSTRLASSFCEFRVGRTKDQLLRRGVSNGDIRRALRRGWIKMAGVSVDARHK